MNMFVVFIVNERPYRISCTRFNSKTIHHSVAIHFSTFKVIIHKSIIFILAPFWRRLNSLHEKNNHVYDKTTNLFDHQRLIIPNHSLGSNELSYYYYYYYFQFFSCNSAHSSVRADWCMVLSRIVTISFLKLRTHICVHVVCILTFRKQIDIHCAHRVPNGHDYTG